MYNLIIKDFLIQKKKLIFSLVYMAFVIVAFQSMGEAMFSAGIVAFTYMLSVNACYYEDKNKSDVMLTCMPIKRIRIVAAKYTSILAYLAIGTILYVALTKIVIILQIPFRVYPLTHEAFIGGIVSVCLMTGIYLPIFFKFGYIKLRVVNFILFFSVFFGISFLANYMQNEPNSVWTQNIISFLNSQGDITIAFLLISVVIIFMLISFGVSVKFYKNREF